MSVQARARRSRIDGSSRAAGLTEPGRRHHGSQVGGQDGDLTGDADPLVAEGAHGHHPALALAAQAAVDRDHGVAEVDLVEHLLAGHVPDGPDLDARGLHVDDEGGDALVLGPALDGRGVGAEQEEAPLGQVGGRDPDLLAVDHVVVAVADGGGAQVGQVVAGVGLGEPLAPVVVGVEDRRQPAAPSAPRCPRR